MDSQGARLRLRLVARTCVHPLQHQNCQLNHPATGEGVKLLRRRVQHSLTHGRDKMCLGFLDEVCRMKTTYRLLSSLMSLLCARTVLRASLHHCRCALYSPTPLLSHDN